MKKKNYITPTLSTLKLDTVNYSELSACKDGCGGGSGCGHSCGGSCGGGGCGGGNWVCGIYGLDTKKELIYRKKQDEKISKFVQLLKERNGRLEYIEK